MKSGILIWSSSKTDVAVDNAGHLERADHSYEIFRLVRIGKIGKVPILRDAVPEAPHCVEGNRVASGLEHETTSYQIGPKTRPIRFRLARVRREDMHEPQRRHR